jgi:uncharacterized membrane protein
MNVLRNHQRIWAGVLAGFVVYFALPAHWPLITRVLVGWDSGVTLTLVLLFIWMMSLNAAQICSRYIEEDSSAPFILVGGVLAAFLSLVAIVEVLATVKQVVGMTRALHVVLATVTLSASWLLLPTLFTTYYADMFYSAAESDRPLKFPETPKPVFWDFLYFSFTIAAACQTADVSTTSGPIRRVVIGHEIISFVFNASILGFAINVTAGLIGN